MTVIPRDDLFLSLVLAVYLVLTLTPTSRAQSNGSTSGTNRLPPPPEATAGAAFVRSCPEAPTIMAQTISYLASGISTNRPSQETLGSPTVQRLRKELSPLRAQGKLGDHKAVSEASARATSSGITAGMRSFPVSGPVGAKVLAVYKKPGEIVHRGEKIALVQLNGRELPITSKVDGVMQEINISKGGILGNRPRSSAQHRKKAFVQIALIAPIP
jgi:biotin carboxyl carrier protein